MPFGGYDEIPFDAYVENMPVPDLGLEFADMFAFMDEFGYTGGEEGVVHVQDVRPAIAHDHDHDFCIRSFAKQRVAARGSMPADYVGGACEGGACLGRSSLSSDTHPSQIKVRDSL